jgi:CHAT domain-containing protein
MVEQALLAAEQLKEESFINEWHRRGGEVRPADRDVYNDMVSRRAHLHALELSATPNSAAKEWRDWLTRFQHVASENPSLAKLIAPVPINLHDVLKTVQSNHAVVVDYLVGQTNTIVFTIDPQRQLTALTLPVGREHLQPQVSALLTASTRTDENARATERRLLQQLYTELLSPGVRKMLPANPEQTVVIVPDSLLYNVPFAALLDPQGKFMVEDHTLTMVSSLTVLMQGPRPEKDFSVVIASDKTGEESECGQISSLFDPASFVALKDAEIGNLQEQAKGTSMIHFTQPLAIAYNNPLHCAMPLTSSASSQEQGHKAKVTANSVFELQLSNDLAVLSNSSVNAKDYRGNAVQVFSRGLNYAGVRNVLMSLWIEPDPIRTAQIVEFYRGRQKGLNQAQSLRKAQLLALSKDPSPRAWAAFQLLGPGF